MSGGEALIAMQVLQPVMEGIAGKSAADKEAKYHDANAVMEATNAARQSLNALRQSRLKAGSSLTSSAAAGQMIGEGSIADMVYANAVERQAEALEIQYQGQTRAQVHRQKASNARSAGKNAMIKGIFGAGAAALTGFQGQANSDRLNSAIAKDRAAQLRQPQPLGSIPLPPISGTVYYPGDS